MSFSGVVVETAMNVTFPALMEEFSVTTATVQWITTGYLLMLALVIPASSYLKRRFAMKALFLTAALLFLLGTVLAAAAPSFSWLLGGRLIQGVGTGLALPLMFNIVLEQAPLDKMGLMIGVASLITAVAPAVGPFAGGAIVEAFGWRMIFVVLLPLLFLSLVFGVTSIRQVSELVRISFPWLEYLLLVCAFACFIFALTGASSAGWFSAHTLGLLAAAAVCAAAFYFHCKSTQAPLIRVQVFRCAPFTLSMLAIVCVQMICLGIGFLIPNYAQLVLHQNAFAAGCLLLPGCGRGGLTVQRSIAGPFRRKAPHSNRKPGNSVCGGVFRCLYPAAECCYVFGYLSLFCLWSGLFYGQQHDQRPAPAQCGAEC